MTHYMELLTTNQPWQLILFMALPLILAETVAITELFILFSRSTNGALRNLNRAASILGGTYFSVVFIYLFFTVAIPLTMNNGWRGIGDIIAVGFYLVGVVPLLGMALLDVGMALLDVGLVGRQFSTESKLKLHVSLVALFLVVAHVAMIFGMLDPTLMQSGAGMADHSDMVH